MNFKTKTSLCVIAVVLAVNFAVISGQKSVDNNLPPQTQVTTEKEVKTTTSEDSDELTSGKTKITSSTSSVSRSLPTIAVKSTSPEVPLGDEPAKEPNSDLPPEVTASSAPAKESTTVPPLIHSSETTQTTTSTTTTTTTSVTMPFGGYVHDSTPPTSSTTTKKPNSASGIHAVKFICFVASAMLVFLR